MLLELCPGGEIVFPRYHQLGIAQLEARRYGLVIGALE